MRLKSKRIACLGIVLCFCGCYNRNEPSESLPLARNDSTTTSEEPHSLIRDYPKNPIFLGEAINSRDPVNGATRLHYAVWNANTELVRDLLRQQADIEAREDFGWTPLYIAAREKRVEIAMILLENGADANATTDDRFTPLHAAAQSGSFRIAEALIAKGATLNARQKDGATPLHMAVGNGHQDIVTLLVEKGADLTVRANDGLTPVEFSRQLGRNDIETAIAAAQDRGAPGSNSGAQTEGSDPRNLSVSAKVSKEQSSYSDIWAYRVTVTTRNTGNSVIRFDKIDAAFLPGAGEPLVQSTVHVEEGSVGPPTGHFELSPGETKEWNFTTAGYTVLLVSSANGILQFQLHFYMQDEVIARLYNPNLPDIRGLPVYDLGQDGVELELLNL